MEVICDTNIWYNIGRGTIKPTDINPSDKLIVTYNSIIEIAISNKLVTFTEDTRKAVRSMFYYSSKHAIHEPPFIYLKKKYDLSYEYELTNKYHEILSFLESFADGLEIETKKIDEYKLLVEDKLSGLEFAAEMYNKVALKIKNEIKDLKKHRAFDSRPINRTMINSWVEYHTKTVGLPLDFDWGQIELFENTLKVFFNEIETGAMIIKPNDWFDLFLLAYVNPNRKIWTKEKKWKRMIINSGMEKYLYEK